MIILSFNTSTSLLTQYPVSVGDRLVFVVLGIQILTLVDLRMTDAQVSSKISLLGLSAKFRIPEVLELKGSPSLFRIPISSKVPLSMILPAHFLHMAQRRLLHSLPSKFRRCIYFFYTSTPQSLSFKGQRVLS